MMKIIPIMLIFSFLFISSLSMGNLPNGRSGESGNTWTFMVYMDADNSLSQYAADDLAEMMSVGSNSTVKIIVMYDSQEFGDSAIYLIEKGKETLLKSMGEVDMGSEKTLEYFLNYSLNNYSSDHYFLDFWDHGNYYGGVCTDHGDWLTLGEIGTALNATEQKIGKKIDVVGFDACRMGGIEIFYSLKNYVDYAVASEKDEPASGWPYNWVLNKISGKKPEQVARVVVDEMYDWAKEFYAHDGLSVTMAYVNLTRMDNFIKVFNDDLSNALSVAPYYSSEIINSTKDVERYELSVVCDFYDFMNRLGKVDDYKLWKLSHDTMEYLESMTYYKAWDCPDPANGYHAKYSHGVGIYYPHYYLSSDYMETSFAEHTLWDEFLNCVLTPGVIAGEGRFKVNISGNNMIINYTTNLSYVDIYVVNKETMETIYSGILPPSGNFRVNIEYGKYEIYVYGYNGDNYTMWVGKENVSYLRSISLKGKFYFNGKIARGAVIELISGNHTFKTIQNKNGFVFNLTYPNEIRDNSTIVIKIKYGLITKEYVERVGNLKGESFLPLIIRERVFPDFEQLVIGTIIITLLVIGVLVYLWRR